MGGRQLYRHVFLSAITYISIYAASGMMSTYYWLVTHQQNNVLARTSLKRTALHSATVAFSTTTVVYVYPYTLPAYNQQCLLILSFLWVGQTPFGPVRWLQLE